MLAQPLGKVSYINYRDAVLQKKLDGHRCLITKYEGKIIAYSRQGKLIPSISHITDLLIDRIPEGETIDGELYHHGTPLQTIGSWIKREQPSTKSLMFVAYDMIARETFRERYSELSQILKGCTGHPIMLLPNVPYETQEHMWDEMAKVRNKGFEGLILRTNDRGYEDGTRSSSLIKIKQFHDTEVKVIGFEQSADGWAVCVYEFEGKVGKCSAPGSMDEKRFVWNNQDRFLGKQLTIEYSMLTVDGVPFHANAIRWREDI
jgi:ATP-dependent DNA ligase